MATIRLNGSAFECLPTETVLECLERNAVPVRSSCRAGTCQSCMVRAVEGAAPLNAQSGIADTMRVQGYFLACSAYPLEDLRIEVGEVAGRSHRVRVESIDRLNENVARLRTNVPSGFAYRAGQFVNIEGPSGALRSYSLASVLGEDEFLECHVRLIPGGAVSSWIHQTLRPGDALTIIGPQGNCFYVPSDLDQPMLLAGTGTGLAPLYGILRDALRQGHSGPIALFHGAVNPKGLYYTEELRAVAAAHENARYLPCVLGGADGADLVQRALDAYIEETLPDLTAFRVYLCGDPGIVKTLQRQAFLAGADMDAILADAFLPAAT